MYRCPKTCGLCNIKISTSSKIRIKVRVYSKTRFIPFDLGGYPDEPTTEMEGYPTTEMEGYPTTAPPTTQTTVVATTNDGNIV